MAFGSWVAAVAATALAAAVAAQAAVVPCGGYGVRIELAGGAVEPRITGEYFLDEPRWRCGADPGPLFRRANNMEAGAGGGPYYLYLAEGRWRLGDANASAACATPANATAGSASVLASSRAAELVGQGSAWDVGSVETALDVSCFVCPWLEFSGNGSAPPFEDSGINQLGRYSLVANRSLWCDGVPAWKGRDWNNHYLYRDRDHDWIFASHIETCGTTGWVFQYPLYNPSESAPIDSPVLVGGWIKYKRVENATTDLHLVQGGKVRCHAEAPSADFVYDDASDWPLWGLVVFPSVYLLWEALRGASAWCTRKRSRGSQHARTESDKGEDTASSPWSWSLWLAAIARKDALARGALRDRLTLWLETTRRFANLATRLGRRPQFVTGEGYRAHGRERVLAATARLRDALVELRDETALGQRDVKLSQSLAASYVLLLNRWASLYEKCAYNSGDLVCLALEVAPHLIRDGRLLPLSRDQQPDSACPPCESPLLSQDLACELLSALCLNGGSVTCEALFLEPGGAAAGGAGEDRVASQLLAELLEAMDSHSVTKWTPRLIWVACQRSELCKRAVLQFGAAARLTGALLRAPEDEWLKSDGAVQFGLLPLLATLAGSDPKAGAELSPASRQLAGLVAHPTLRAGSLQQFSGCLVRLPSAITDPELVDALILQRLARSLVDGLVNVVASDRKSQNFVWATPTAKNCHLLDHSNLHEAIICSLLHFMLESAALFASSSRGNARLLASAGVIGPLTEIVTHPSLLRLPPQHREDAAALLKCMADLRYASAAGNFGAASKAALAMAEDPSDPKAMGEFKALGRWRLANNASTIGITWGTVLCGGLLQNLDLLSDVIVVAGWIGESDGGDTYEGAAVFGTFAIVVGVLIDFLTLQDMPGVSWWKKLSLVLTNLVGPYLGALTLAGYPQEGNFSELRCLKAIFESGFMTALVFMVLARQYLDGRGVDAVEILSASSSLVCMTVVFGDIFIKVFMINPDEWARKADAFSGVFLWITCAFSFALFATEVSDHFSPDHAFFLIICALGEIVCVLHKAGKQGVEQRSQQLKVGVFSALVFEGFGLVAAAASWMVAVKLADPLYITRAAVFTACCFLSPCLLISASGQQPFGFRGVSVSGAFNVAAALWKKVARSESAVFPTGGSRLLSTGYAAVAAKHLADVPNAWREFFDVGERVRDILADRDGVAGAASAADVSRELLDAGLVLAEQRAALRMMGDKAAAGGAGGRLWRMRRLLVGGAVPPLIKQGLAAFLEFDPDPGNEGAAEAHVARIRPLLDLSRSPSETEAAAHEPHLTGTGLARWLSARNAVHVDEPALEAAEEGGAAASSTVDPSQMRVLLLKSAANPELWKSADVTDAAAKEAYGLSEDAERADYFVSHSWNDSARPGGPSLKADMLAGWLYGQQVVVNSVVMSVALAVVAVPFGILLDIKGWVPWFVIPLLFIAAGWVVCAWVALASHMPPALQPWRLADRVLWIDKCCISQESLKTKQEGIQHLDEFMAKCDKLLVLYSHTYFTRLWCVHELATFIKNRGIGAVEFVGMDWPPWWNPMTYLRPVELSDEEVRLLKNFSCRDALCFMPRDRAHVLGVIRLKWGSEAEFDQFVRTELVDILLQAKRRYCHGRPLELLVDAVDFLVG